MQPDGTYEKQDLRGKAKLDSQMYFVEEARKRRDSGNSVSGKDRVFIPVEAHE
jgi:polyphosphate kinase